MAIGTPVECFAVNSTSRGTTAFSPTANVTSGGVAFIVGNNNGAKTITSISDSKGNTWVADPTATFNDGVRTTNIAWAEITTTILTSDTITITWSGAASKSHDTWVQNVSGLDASSIFDQTAHASASTANPSTGATPALSQSSEIVWATLRGNGATPSAGSGFTQATTFLVGGSLLEYQIVSSTTGLAGTFTQGATAWCAMVATYRGAAATTPISDTETETGADGGEAIAAALTDAETGTGADAGESIAAALTDAETGSAADAGESIAAALSDADTAHSTDAGEAIAANVADAEAGSVADAGESIVVNITDAEIAAFLDAGETIAANVADTDTGSITEAGTAVATVNITDADTFTFVDAGEHIGKPPSGLAGLTSPARKEGLTNPGFTEAAGLVLTELGGFVLTEDGGLVLLEIS